MARFDDPDEGTSQEDLQARVNASRAAWLAAKQAREKAEMDKYGGYSKGGKVKKTFGKKVGKDSGMIPASKGEYVVKKSAAKKYGPAKMAAVNSGKAKVSAPAAKKRGR